MEKFAEPQRTFRIDGVAVGGQPGELPPVLIGSMFYAGHDIVRDSRRGLFDRDRARALLEAEAELSAATGLPRMVDVVGDTGQALLRYIEFVAQTTTAPVVVDSPSPQARMEVVKHFGSTELAGRLVYCPLAADAEEEEIEELSESQVRAAVAMTLDPRRPEPRRRLEVLQNRLLPAAERAGITALLVDVGVPDLPGLGPAARAVREVKGTLGYPAGCGPSGAFYAWRRARRVHPPAVEAAGGAVLALPLAWGADFLFYGPIASAPWVYPACAAASALVASAGRAAGVRPLTRMHPLYRIF
ncbi:MAG: hypothetical protein K6T75_01225 [Acetobacteraceae bacterium]|nr:hypothetical protein [Acetobacteraceae bacterium]